MTSRPETRTLRPLTRATLLVLVLGAMTLPSGALAGQASNPQERARLSAEALRDAERAFAADAAARGAKTAFLAVLDEGSILYGPHAVDGRTRMENIPEFPGWLQWTPAYVEVSPDGTLGYTTGPYTFTSDGQVPTESGRYFSIWREDDGWRLALDLGLVAPAAEVDEPLLVHHGTETLGVPVQGESVRDADERWRALVRRDGTDAAYATLGGHRALVLRPAKAARRGSMEMDRRPIGDPTIESSVVEGGDCSDDGVLCYLYGRDRSPGASSDANWVRIWRAHRDGGWALVLDLRQGG